MTKPKPNLRHKVTKLSISEIPILFTESDGQLFKVLPSKGKLLDQRVIIQQIVFTRIHLRLYPRNSDRN